MSYKVLKTSCSIETVNMSIIQSHFKKNPMKINELLTIILNKLKVQEMIHLRVVCSNWKFAIESICKFKRNLKLTCLPSKNDQIQKRFFGSINIRKFAVLKIKPQLNCTASFEPNLFIFLGQLFPSVDQLIVDAILTSSCANNLHEVGKKYWKDLTTFSLEGILPTVAPLCCDQLNQMKSIKKLDLYGFLDTDLRNVEIFSQLEHFSCYNYSYVDLLEIMPPLEPKCTSFWFEWNLLSVQSLSRWFERNCPTILANLTHLSLTMVNDNDGSLIRLISKNCRSLQVLNIKYSYWVEFNHSTNFQLAKLSQLRKLSIVNALLDLDSLEDNQNPLNQFATSIRVFHLIDFGFILGPPHGNGLAHFDVARFCSILRSIVPNLEVLGIYSPRLPYDSSIHIEIENNLNQQLDKFVKYEILARGFDF